MATDPGRRRARDARLSDQGSLGAIPSQDGVRFRVWAPQAGALQLLLHDGPAAGARLLARYPDGTFEIWVKGAAAGNRYSYVLDDSEPLPDPASRFQPDGVHGSSQVVDPDSFQWHDQAWHARPARDLIVYELHVGTFSPAGTFDGVRQRLPYLRDLGVTAIELMPVADFAGQRNWGYDGVALFAPARVYGTPDDLRRLVDAAHSHGLSVILDVVYNHMGPEGAYLPRFSSGYLTHRHQTPWGHAVNLDAAESMGVRRFILDNAVHWVREYHIDALRLDATHALIDKSPKGIVQEIAEVTRAAVGRPVVVHAEDHRNLAAIVEDPRLGGWGLDGVWADDFHHAVRCIVAGDHYAYFADFAGTTTELAAVIQRGWLFSGEYSEHLKRPRGTDPSRVPMHRFIVCLQNHDQVGNRAMGDRLHHAIPEESWRAVTVLLLMVPMTPLLFMGQEWAASTPFQYFTDLEPGLGRLVTEGRRREFAGCPGFDDPTARERIPDPQAESTFADSHLRWEEQTLDRHQRSLALYRALIGLRLKYVTLTGGDMTSGFALAPDADSVVVKRSDGFETFWIVARFRSPGTVDLTSAAEAHGAEVRTAELVVVMDTEHAEYAGSPYAIDVDDGTVQFQRAGAIILKQR